ncbi:beta-glucuronosyltransferase GlcAT14B-like isoform X2 [Macadamia integrifolia]|uniref:beta-glucuronosyltransferase GlcAT14B-like isoform X2 n=1 Tax=Macadamia integrifolia TaxID=60698 RepID=UPI001C4E635C|nr:beta-glucuronosyltransferase GlcAT14B-like isoform X2 [Macadamia integrifolia]
MKNSSPSILYRLFLLPMESNNKKKWFLPLVCSLLLSSLFISASLFSYYDLSPFSRSSSNTKNPIFIESKLRISSTSSTNPIPRIAYLISGSTGDGESLKRTLKALYHPLNHYVVHLDLEASPSERLDLVDFVRREPLFAKVGNVRVVMRSNLVTYRGPTMVSNTLHAASILFREGGDWDWFINLSASDYPLVTQDGSAWMMLSRPFIEYCLWGWENLPRVVLMYYANFLSSPEGYFHTVICNAEEFRNTTVNHDLHFISWDNPPKQHPHFLNANDFQRMVDSNAPFARKFGRNESVLNKIDEDLLSRSVDGFVHGGWFDNGANMSSIVQHYSPVNAIMLRPGPGAERLKRLINGLLSQEDFHGKQCT